ncbi:unnamed protein product [Ambrosiozyma monospora]|uniref:Unnamed protein product n=1 Tax=Ambrosiozyma monospora TaxID=43982 RepID=A0ACB5U0E3_AMBMO|nr:unnamed protein product [Ambrosiozyma monospora]
MIVKNFDGAELGPNSYDIIIVDSVETGKRLRLLPEIKYVPLVLLHPCIPALNMRDCLDLGISSYGNTPCSVLDLASILKPAFESKAVAPNSDGSTSYKILLAEDNLVNQKLAVKILEKRGHKVKVVENGLQAVEAIKEEAFDVILMDVQMPIMGGFEATANIREWEKKKYVDAMAFRTPIIALTAHAMLGDRERCLKAQMDEYLSKPLKPALLVQTIAKCVHNMNQMKQLSRTQNTSMFAESLKNGLASGSNSSFNDLNPPRLEMLPDGDNNNSNSNNTNNNNNNNSNNNNSNDNNNNNNN